MRKGFLRSFAKFRGKHLCRSPFFNKVAGLRPATFLKKRLWHRCFPLNFANFQEHLFYKTPLGDGFWTYKNKISLWKLHIFTWFWKYFTYVIFRGAPNIILLNVTLQSCVSLKSDSHPPKKLCICFNETTLKMMKNTFYFTLKALFVLKIFKVLSWLFGHVEKRLD